MLRITLLSGLVLCSCTPAPHPDALASLVERHTTARGGRAAIEAVRAVEIDLKIIEPTFAVDGSYAATRDGQMRIDVYSDGERVFTEAVDGARSWSMEGGETHGRAGPEKATAALLHGTEFPFKLYGLHEMIGRGHRLQLLGEEMLDGVSYSVVQLRLNDGFEVRYYLNPATGLIERDRQSRALHVEVDPTPQWIETSYSDYRPVAGVLFPFRQIERVVDTGEVLSSGEVKAVRVNPPIDAGRFSMP